MSDTDLVYLYQITIRERHPVNSNGLLRKLRDLKLLETFVNSEVKVFLIFLVTSETYSKQTIQTDDARWDSSIDQIRGLPRRRKEELRLKGITTVMQLRDYLSDNDPTKIKRFGFYLEDFAERIANRPFEPLVVGIPQYFMCVDLNISVKRKRKN